MSRPPRARHAALPVVAILVVAIGPGCAHRTAGSNLFAEQHPAEPYRNWFGEGPSIEDREDLVGMLDTDPVDEADLLIQQGRHAEAEALLREVVVETPEGWKPMRIDDGVVSYAAWDLEEFVRARKSGAFGDQTLEWSQPSYSRAWYLLAMVARHDGDAAGTRACLERADGLEPGNPRILNELGSTALAAGRPYEALSYFNDAIVARTWETDEVRGRAYRGAAAALARTDRLVQAADLLVRSLQIEPGHPEAEEALVRIRAMQADEPMSDELRDLMADALDLPGDAETTAGEEN